MSNTNFPFGFRPLGLDGAVQPTFGLKTAKIAYNNTNAIYRGDPIIRLNTGYVDVWPSTTDRGLMVGIFWSAKYPSTSLGRTTQNTYWPGNDVASTGTVTCYYIPLSGTPSPLFVVQTNGTAITFADVGMNIDPATGTGSIKGTYGLSGFTVDQATINTTNTLAFKIEGLWSDYAPTGSNGTDNTSSYNCIVVRGNTFGETGV